MTRRNTLVCALVLALVLPLAAGAQDGLSTELRAELRVVGSVDAVRVVTTLEESVELGGEPEGREIMLQRHLLELKVSEGTKPGSDQLNPVYMRFDCTGLRQRCRELRPGDLVRVVALFTRPGLRFAGELEQPPQLRRIEVVNP